jgi:putative heme iron utilization protein
MKDIKLPSELEAVNLFRSSETAILSTLSKSTDNYPFGSFTTYATSCNRDLFVYTSDIAEHTKNILHDSRACLTITSVTTDGDKQTSPRLSLIGDLVPVNSQDIKKCKTRFLTFLPKSEKYSQMHGFNFYQLNIIKARWIGGFGKIAWLNNHHWIMENPSWEKNESAMIEHMNQDHRNVIGSALNATFGISDPEAKMIAICTDGYYIKSKTKCYFIGFDQPCYSQETVRRALVKQAHAHRSYELNKNNVKENLHSL